MDIAESLIYNWRSAQRKAANIASEPLQFIPYDVVTDAAVAEPIIALTPVPTTSALAATKPSSPAASTDAPVRPHPGARPGGTDIDLLTGVRLSVDNYVNQKALAGVLRSLGHAL